MPQQVLDGTVRVVIHAPSPLVRAGLANFVALDPRLDELPRERIREADVIVVALDAADASALDLLPRLCDEPGARFLVVVGRQWRADTAAARRRGVRAVVRWDFCSPDLFARSVRAVAARPRTAPELDPREVDVLRLIAEGKQVDEIATELSYSARTVRYILYGAMKRTRTRNRAHAVSYAIRAGLI
ncbi:DNA-binding NarL/FixJ family response regulator [Streptomyces sp. V3I8]|jgi:DNA-binding NarL/FixJ family response regulator|uniref:helix-turn-helix transcriptional regulator n=1 Tax=Streptomyces sp. V3I8 TaxID=3042279 RepID=UPI002783125D|nr:helix-turn-helix transcriptional regulator [Streptomyces sp. V3I8]MDQ1040443.1 DNA-binding NarL/FixJ family response regulator [Streptomyces sp. V3I8]